MCWRRQGLGIVLVAVTVACSEEGTAEPSPTACELLTAEREGCDAPATECEGEVDECNAGCVLGLPCEELLDPGQDPGAVVCLWHCAPRFQCEDGSIIYKQWVCDGEADCVAGEDETQCKGSKT